MTPEKKDETVKLQQKCRIKNYIQYKHSTSGGAGGEGEYIYQIYKARLLLTRYLLYQNKNITITKEAKYGQEICTVRAL